MEIGQRERLLEGEAQTLSHCSWSQAEDMANRHCLSSLWGVRSYRNILLWPSWSVPFLWLGAAEDLAKDSQTKPILLGVGNEVRCRALLFL